MIILKLVSVFWLSICSMFSHGSRESSNFQDYKELDVQESSLLSKDAYTKTLSGGRTGYVFLTFQEYITDVDKLNYFCTRLDGQFGTYIGGQLSSFVRLPDYETMNPQYDSSFIFDWYPSVDGLTNVLYFYSDFDAVIQSFDFDFGNMFKCSHIRLEYHNDTSYPNTHSTYKFTLYNEGETYSYSICSIQFYDPINPVSGNPYNGNIIGVQTPQNQPLNWYYEDNNYRWGICFRNNSYSISVYNDTYTYQSSPTQEVYDNGYQAGYENRGTDNYDEGYQVGYTAGQQTRTDQDYQAGYNDGVIDAGGTNPYLNSIANGIFQIGLLPVNVFLTIFNFELFGINISGLVSGLLTMTVVVIIFRFLFGGKSNDK